ncbi:phage tail tube protein [Streptococcus agalactiae]|uniref:phage tail tube protein n=1 Tax=Streptococcus agalactiae TaxID=1311 RepID=UPI00210E8B01|nr:phage tail protein [Streptococcus agalactiae]MCQ3822712.1 phage tail protein [Streptococcus agalactiae]MCQ3825074.1 phage tail protein [Streptococcus agalactiae]MCQ3827754.1 phage tail protein [Streptococcus agalactiae]
MVANSSNVTTAKPKIGGAIYTAPIGTELPKDTTTELNEAFKSLGYISEDGLSNEDKRESEEIQAWGGDVVESAQKSKADKFTYTLIEALNIEVLKEIYGKDNVSGDLKNGITVKSNSKALEEHCLVIEMILKNNTVKRIVIPKGKVAEVGEIKYVDNEAAGYETTVQAFPDAEGNTHYEYIKGAG